VPSHQTPSSTKGCAEVRRVEKLFRQRTGTSVTLAEAAAAAGCSVRSLQLAFRRHRGTTPMAAWRRIRLEAARAALVRADGAASIGGIAAEHGFSNPGRFAKLLREAFGQSPTQILRRAGPE
jgi:transcriptional regulator GlxA family with amidase domain